MLGNYGIVQTKDRTIAGSITHTTNILHNNELFATLLKEQGRRNNEKQKLI